MKILIAFIVYLPVIFDAFWGARKHELKTQGNTPQWR